MTGPAESRRRWVIRPRPDDEDRSALRRLAAETAENVLVVEVVAGQVVVSAGGGRTLVFPPADVSRVRRALAHAQARALLDRGRW